MSMPDHGEYEPIREDPTIKDGIDMAIRFLWQYKRTADLRDLEAAIVLLQRHTGPFHEAADPLPLPVITPLRVPEPVDE